MTIPRVSPVAYNSTKNTYKQRTQQSSLLRLRPPPKRSPRWRSQRRSHATATTTLAIDSEARFNEIGVQHVSKHIHDQLFPARQRRDKDEQTSSQDDAEFTKEELVDLSRKHLAHHELLGKQSDNAPPIAFDMPALQGKTMDEHFHRLGLDSTSHYLTLVKHYARASPPPRPRKWLRRAGWTKYSSDGTTEEVEFPDAEVLTFDVEVLYHETSFPAMATAVSATHWYAWLSPWLLDPTSTNDRHLIPLGDPAKKRVVVGHNISYDRARIKEEYSLQQTGTFFVDTMSLHVAVNGMCSRQRPSWTKARKAREFQDEVSASEEYEGLSSLISSSGDGSMEQEEDLWVGRSSANSLRDVAKFHCGITVDKSRRDSFGSLDREGVLEKLDELLDYCAADVEVTHKVYKRVLPAFLETCPHPVSFAALRHLGTCILPVDKGWEEYLEKAEATYQRLSKGVGDRLAALAEKALVLKGSPERFGEDPWLRQLDWSGQEVRMTKAGRPAKGQKKMGEPKWYKDLFARDDSEIALTVRTRIAPLLLRLAWDGFPLVWSDKYGWTFRVPLTDRTAVSKYEKGMTECDMSEDSNMVLGNDREGRYFKLPHPDGPAARCASPMAKGYAQFFESGVLGSEYGYAREALEMNGSCSYWISVRNRVGSQMVVRADEVGGGDGEGGDLGLGFILPQVIPMGTITRRAVENTWLTASNAKSNRVGSELKSIVTAPAGWSFVGADVDSQELWIASLVGDAQFGIHGGGALGFMTLEGSKGAGTDLHSRTAGILGISRNDAKVFNYGRIYGAGVKFAQTLLRRFNPGLSGGEAEGVARELYAKTKGVKVSRKVLKAGGGFWVGGTESLVFNKLEGMAMAEKPRTPVLGAGITEALMKRFLGKGGNGGFAGGKSEGQGSSYLTSRINWAIQSSGVDYLHLLIVGMEYLCRRYGIRARLALTVHDEIRYLAKEEDKYRCAMALQVANVWTRALFSQEMGIEDLPQSCAYFSAVDIDHVLRKEVDMTCVTPSHPEIIPPGESLGIEELLAKGSEALLDPKAKAEREEDVPRPERCEYHAREPVMKGLKSANPKHYLRAQLAKDKGEVLAIAKELGPGGVGRPLKDNPHTDRDDSVVVPKVRRSKSKTIAQPPSARRIHIQASDPTFNEWAWLREMNDPQKMERLQVKAPSSVVRFMDNHKWDTPRAAVAASVYRH
ncbi:DNA-directed DNA polymerase gamma mip1 [Elasticomyces elasticus]|nr:DNA-directed DNA polymerase gamma mip1 [Elasticomyces elasticus]